MVGRFLYYNRRGEFRNLINNQRVKNDNEEISDICPHPSIRVSGYRYIILLYNCIPQNVGRYRGGYVSCLYEPRIGTGV